MRLTMDKGYGMEYIEAIRINKSTCTFTIEKNVYSLPLSTSLPNAVLADTIIPNSEIVR